MNRSECKKSAKELMKNNWIMGFVVVLIYSAIIAGLGAISGGIATIILSSSLLIAMFNVFISAYHGKGYEVSYMLKGWDKGLSNRIALSALKFLYIFLWSLLFIIPGIVKSYSYYLAEFISREYPEKTAKECLDESRKLMDGKKMDLFLLDLSFLGWHILSVLTCGVLYVWVLPYMYQTIVVFIDKNIYPLVELDNKENYIETEVKTSTEVRYCYNCGRKIEDNENYCSSCGTKVR